LQRPPPPCPGAPGEGPGGSRFGSKSADIGPNRAPIELTPQGLPNIARAVDSAWFREVGNVMCTVVFYSGGIQEATT
jgi:hypothetical protein